MTSLTQVGVGENDTVAVFQVLNQDASVLSSLSKIHGPWAFVYWQVCCNFSPDIIQIPPPPPLLITPPSFILLFSEVPDQMLKILVSMSISGFGLPM